VGKISSGSNSSIFLLSLRGCLYHAKHMGNFSKYRIILNARKMEGVPLDKYIVFGQHSDA
jgi:hypothetical protein